MNGHTPVRGLKAHIGALYADLPPEGSSWTLEKRDKWFSAVRALMDYYTSGEEAEKPSANAAEGWYEARIKVIDSIFREILGEHSAGMTTTEVIAAIGQRLERYEEWLVSSEEAHGLMGDEPSNRRRQWLRERALGAEPEIPRDAEGIR